MGLSFEITGKYTSERHEAAKRAGKFTAGDAAILLSKKLGKKILANNIKPYSKEWHHSGFYAGGMGKTWFFSQDEINFLIENYESIKEKEKKELERYVYGFYWIWDYDFNGKNGKKRSFKILNFYSGIMQNAHKNFTEISEQQFKDFSYCEGKCYYGWEVPTIDEITNYPTFEQYQEIEKEKVHQKKLARRRELYRQRKLDEKVQMKQIEKTEKVEEIRSGLSNNLFRDFFSNEFHPAPEVVHKAKLNSGLTWNRLREIFKD